MLNDRISPRRLLYDTPIAKDFAAPFMAVVGPSHPSILVGGLSLSAYSADLGLPYLTWVWSSDLFPTWLCCRARGFCDRASRLAIAINVFLIPIGVATLEFTVSIVLLSPASTAQA